MKLSELALSDAVNARAYLLAASRVLGSDTGNVADDVPVFAPANHLIAHGVELALIAFLRSHGVKGGFSDHDIVGRFEAAMQAGLRSGPMLEHYVRMTGPALKTNQFRYSKPVTSPFVSPRSALQIVQPEVDRIFAAVMERARQAD